MKISRINPLYFYGGTQSNNRLKFEGQDIFTRNINEDKIMQNNASDCTIDMQYCTKIPGKFYAKRRNANRTTKRY